MPLRRCMRSHTLREYRIWMAYLDEQWNQPNRTDHYLMQIARDVKRVLSRHPGKIQLDDSKLTFEQKADKPKQTKEQAAAVSKAAWMGRVGMVRVVEAANGSG